MLSDIIYLRVELHNTLTTCKQFLQPFARTSTYFNSYIASSVRLWNALTSSIVNYRTFKLSCKEFLYHNCSYAFSFEFLLYWLHAIRNLHMILFMMYKKKRIAILLQRCTLGTYLRTVNK